MKLYLILIMILAMPFVQAEVIQANTTVTIDWIGNDMFYLRTESGDLLLNSSIQNDMPYTINITRVTGTNQSEFEEIQEQIHNITRVCGNLSTQLGYTSAFQNELLLNYTRCSLDKEALMKELPECESKARNLTTESGSTISILTSQKATLLTTVDSCNAQLTNISAALSAEQGSSSTKTVIAIICAIVAGVLILQEVQKKQKAHPDEMSLLSQT